MATLVRDNPDASRYEILVDDEVAGFIDYHARKGLIALVHTEIGDRHGGQGLGTTLVTGALDDARARGLRVLPFCPFVNAFLVDHEKYRDLVPADHREHFGL